MYCGIDEKRMLVVKGALFSSNYFNYKKKRKRRQKLHNLVSKSWQTMVGSSAIYTTLTLGSMYLYMTSFFLKLDFFREGGRGALPSKANKELVSKYYSSSTTWVFACSPECRQYWHYLSTVCLLCHHHHHQ